MIKPDLLKNKLVEGLQMEQERAAVVVSVWSSNASLIVESLRKRSVLPHQVLMHLALNAILSAVYCMFVIIDLFSVARRYHMASQCGNLL